MKTRYSSIDPYYGPYDTEEQALEAMEEIGKDGRLVCIYSNKSRGIVGLYTYNSVAKNFLTVIYPVEIDKLLSEKVDKEDEKSLVNNELITKLSELQTKEELDSSLSNKVDKVLNKSLVDDTQITKLSDLNTQAQLDTKINNATSNANASLIPITSLVLPRGVNIPSYITNKGVAKLKGNDTTVTTYTNTGTTPSTITVSIGCERDAYYDKVSDVWTAGLEQKLPTTPIANTIVEGGTSAVSQDAVYKHVNPLYNLFNTTIQYNSYSGVYNSGYTGNTGLFVSNSAYKSTDFIAVKEGDIIRYKGMPNDGSLTVPAVVGFNNTAFSVVVKNHQFVTNAQFSDVVIPAGIDAIKVNFFINGSEALQIPFVVLSSYKGVVIGGKQLFNINKELIDVTNFKEFGYFNNRYISNVTGALNSAASWKTLNIPLDNYKGNTKLTISNFTFGGNKYYRFIDKDNNLISFTNTTVATFTLDIPSNAYTFQLVFKNATDPTNINENLMINFGTVALPLEAFTENPYAVKSIDNNPVISSSSSNSNPKIDTKKSIAYIGNSITINGVNGTLIGYQLWLNQVFSFTKYTTYGYSGQPFGTFVTPNGNAIIEQFIKTATTHDIFVLVCPATNDFKLGTRLGTFEDYKNLTSYGTTTNIISLNFYQALKAFMIRCYELNPKAKIIITTDLQRNNTFWDNGGVQIPYDSRNPNPVGIYLKDFVQAIRTVAEYESIAVVDLWKESGINLMNIMQYTSDGLHPIDECYKLMSNLMEPKIKYVLT